MVESHLSKNTNFTDVQTHTELNVQSAIHKHINFLIQKKLQKSVGTHAHQKKWLARENESKIKFIGQSFKQTNEGFA